MTREPQTHAGRVALVTGAAKGIGREIAIRLAKRGAALVLVDRENSEETSALIAADSAAAPLVIAIDVADPSGWCAVGEAVEARHGRADILVNNAGIFPYAEFDDLDLETWSRVLAVNLTSQFLGAKTLVPMMRRSGWGRIVNIASNSICTNDLGLSHYMASKMGVIGFTRGLANDLGACGITVNAVAPSITRTPGTSVLPDDMLFAISNKQSIKRLAGPQDIAAPVLFLTSEDCAFVTGQLLAVDGGMLKTS